MSFNPRNKNKNEISNWSQNKKLILKQSERPICGQIYNRKPRRPCVLFVATGFNVLMKLLLFQPQLKTRRGFWGLEKTLFELIIS